MGTLANNTRGAEIINKGTLDVNTAHAKLKKFVDIVNEGAANHGKNPDPVVDAISMNNAVSARAAAHTQAHYDYEAAVKQVGLDKHKPADGRD